MEKFTSKKKFRESLGAICDNDRWSWSWVNHKSKKVYFGASDIHEGASSQLILSHQWKQNKKGRQSPAYKEALRNINLVQNQEYELYTFRQFEKVENAETGRAKIISFEQALEQRYIVERNDDWYAVVITDFEAKDNLPKSIEKVVYLEGSRVPIAGSRIERNSQARDACLKEHGFDCWVCKFDFEKVYGELGKEFIHVHHLKLISECDGIHVVDPSEDLKPLCPNCHAMVHRYGKNRSLEDIKELISINEKTVNT